MSDDKVNIFEVLSKFNTHSADFFRDMDPDTAKQLHPFVVQRWLSGTDNPAQIVMINELVNRKVFALAHNHKLLTWFLLLAATCNTSGRYQWSKLPSSKNNTKPLSIEVVCKYYGYSKTKARDAIAILTPQDMLELAHEIGMQDTDIRKLEKELGVSPSKKPRSAKR